MHHPAWHHMLGWDNAMVLGRVAVREALFDAMGPAGWLGLHAADALVWLLHMPLCGSRAGIKVFGYPLCSHIRAPFEVAASDCLQPSAVLKCRGYREIGAQNVHC